MDPVQLLANLNHNLSSTTYSRSECMSKGMEGMVSKWIYFSCLKKISNDFIINEQLMYIFQLFQIKACQAMVWFYSWFLYFRLLFIWKNYYTHNATLAYLIKKLFCSIYLYTGWPNPSYFYLLTFSLPSA